ncbi:hypothetical protein ACODG4_05265 [Vagococcus fluvialis]|uniref:hypothetical protein n=1 Tax=Vagococcus fluvialis TaxID=2738 RepID=UPI003B5B8E3C
MEQATEEKPNKKKTHKIAKVIGTTSVVIGSAVVATKAVPKLATVIYKSSVRYFNRKKDEDDWGPELVRKIDYKRNEGDNDAN